MPSLDPRHRLFVALDTDDPERAIELVNALHSTVGGFKIGLELFGRWGPAGIEAVASRGARVFCDLKLHDIPNTVARAAAVLGGLGATYLTVHALGGPAMIAGAVQGARDGADARGRPSPLVLAVTVLTSHDDHDLVKTGIGGPTDRAAARLAALALEAGADGVVCSAHEVLEMRRTHPTATLVVPGIRPRGLSVTADDQSRTATPADAIARGADLLVVGRPITMAADPAATAAAIVDEIASA